MEAQVEKFKQFASSLQELIECPVCFGSMDSTLKQCLNGHGICSSCARKIEKCPSCQQKVIVQKSTLLGQILDRLPKICVYADYGCNTILFDREHQPFCQFRPFNCLNKSCKWRGCVKYLLQHVKECYDDNEICRISSLNTKQLKPFTITECEDNPLKIPIIFQNQLFYNCIFKSKDVKPGKIVILYRFYHVPTSKPTCNFYIVARFKKGKIKFKLTYLAKTVMDHSQISDELGDDGIDEIDGILVMAESDLRSFTKPGSSDNQYEHTLELESEDL